MLTNIFTFSVILSSLLIFLVFFFYHFLSVWKIFYSHSFRWIYCSRVILLFHLSFSPSFPKDFFLTEYRILSWQPFSFSTWKNISPLPSSLHDSKWEFCYHLNWYSSLSHVSFLSTIKTLFCLQFLEVWLQCLIIIEMLGLKSVCGFI